MLRSSATGVHVRATDLVAYLNHGGKQAKLCARRRVRDSLEALILVFL